MVQDSWKLHHLGHPVKDIDKALEFYKKTGIAEIEPEIFLIPTTKRITEYSANWCT